MNNVVLHPVNNVVLHPVNNVVYFFCQDQPEKNMVALHNVLTRKKSYSVLVNPVINNNFIHIY